jgi:hypothetical protein
MTLLLGAFEWEADPLRVGAAASDRRAAFAYGGTAVSRQALRQIALGKAAQR